ncbi:hypothetical protein B484DRAFT_425637 [Ochromonadaceae sp. CCMP2298]|nr:hypothetical protein B484DRAFT_425637 [Ochromonadaceae sp. CCMP2298]
MDIHGNNIFPETKILDLVLSYVCLNSPENRCEGQKYDYLKRIGGLPLVCKAFHNSCWRNHPDFVKCKAYSEVVCLLHKIPQLRKIHLTVRAISVASDIDHFQRSLLFVNRRWKSLSDVLPRLQLLDLTPTLCKDTGMSNEEVMRMVCGGIIDEDDEQWEFQCYLIERDEMLYISSIPFLQKSKYRLDKFLPTAPEGLTLRLFQLAPPQKLHKVHTLIYSNT